MVTIVVQNLGKSWAVGIKGEDEGEIVDYYNMFYNWKATNIPEPHWMNEGKFAYFWTSRERFTAALLRISLNSILNKDPDKYKGMKGGALEAAKKQAIERLEAMPSEYFITQDESLIEEAA